MKEGALGPAAPAAGAAAEAEAAGRLQAVADVLR